MATTEFGMLLKRFLNDAGKNQQWLAGKMGVDEAIISNFNTPERLPRLEETVYKHMLAMFPHLISEHVVTSKDQARELVSKIPFKYETNLAKKYRATLESEVIDILQKQRELDKPKYYTRQGIPFIGRESDIEAIITKLQEAKTQRFLTLVGAPGTGKTELARQAGDVAKERGHFADVHFISIEPVTSGSKMRDLILEILTERQMRPLLLILDNCEQIQDIDETRGKLRDVLKAYPQVTFLATSRYIFSLREQEVKPLNVLSLSSDDQPEKLLKNLTIQLFLARANINREESNELRLTEENARYIVGICKACDGLPLALLMAASWVNELPLKSVYTAFVKKNRPYNKSIQKRKYHFKDSEHHTTLDQAIAVSYILLEDEEQMLFRWLSAFPLPKLLPGIKLYEFFRFYDQVPTWVIPLPPDAACPLRIVSVRSLCVLGEFSGRDDVENILSELSYHHLITYEGDRWVGIHNTLREYGRRKLDEKQESTKIKYHLLSYHYLCKHEFFMNDYKKEKLENYAKDLKFLEEEKNDIILMIGLDKVLAAYTLANDIFRRRYPGYQEILLESAIQSYRLQKSEGLTPDEKRHLFFTVFDAVYKEALTQMFDIEKLIAYGRLCDKPKNDNKALWYLWDTECGSLLGL